MPNLENPWGAALVDAVRTGLVPEEIIDEKVRRVLLLALRTGALQGSDVAPSEELDGFAVAHEVAARSFVLVRNENFTLPLKPSALSRVAVIGALAQDARVLGGGSAQVAPPHTISPLDGLVKALSGVDVRYAVGADPRPFLPAGHGDQWSDIRMTIGGRTFPLDQTAVRWIGSLPCGLPLDAVDGLRLEATFTPAEDGEHTFAISGFGTFRRLLRCGIEPWEISHLDARLLPVQNADVRSVELVGRTRQELTIDCLHVDQRMGCKVNGVDKDFGTNGVGKACGFTHIGDRTQRIGCGADGQELRSARQLGFQIFEVERTRFRIHSYRSDDDPSLTLDEAQLTFVSLRDGTYDAFIATRPCL